MGQNGLTVTIACPRRFAENARAIVTLMAENGAQTRLLLDPGDLTQVPGIEDTSVLLCAAVPCRAAEMDSMPTLRGIVSPILGYDWIDVDAATQRAIPVVNGEVEENRESMAEATVMLLLALLYRLPQTEALARRGDAATRVQRRMLKGRSIGIVGYGGISRHIVKRLESWECDIMVATRNPPQGESGVRFVSLDELIATSDAVLVMTSLQPSTRGLLDRERLAKLKPGAILVNTARGGLIDEAALVNALRSGHVAAAALDVFEVEPLPMTSALRELDNVILTPHAVGHTTEALRAGPRLAAQNVDALIRGILPQSCRNREVETAWLASR